MVPQIVMQKYICKLLARKRCPIYVFNVEATGKFHVVPIYETEDELTYEEEENETQYTSSAMDTTTPMSFSGQAKNYKVVKPLTPK